MPFGRHKRTCGFGYDICQLCFNSLDTKCQNIGSLSRQPSLCSCIPLLVDDHLKDGYMPVCEDESEESCYFMRPIYGCKDNESSSEDSNETSDCDSEAIRSNSDSTESFSRVASFTDAVLVRGNCGSA
jgi:hypothetical protein